MTEIARKRTKLEKAYYRMRLVTVGINYCFVMSLFCLVLPFSFLLVPFFMMLYVIYALFVTIFMVVCTFFLILLTVNDPESPLAQVWARVEKIAELIEPVRKFAAVAVPIIGGITIILSIILRVSANKRLSISPKAKDKAFLIISIIFSVIGIAVGLFVGLS